MAKNLPANAGDTGWIPGLGRSLREENGKKMATHASILAWEIPWTEEPAIHGLQKRVRRDLATKQQQQQDSLDDP